MSALEQQETPRLEQQIDLASALPGQETCRAALARTGTPVYGLAGLVT